ncbi:hypothetical protein [Paenibacillus ginsengarvi]|uniref:Pectate lyase superfamily protein domain-containing protein n=1 Tax=Paenibacillus ginsengarvi TaxID=400777 RepID=A0A3B0AUT6_9BACL|nr:hypothetical protein [Paenibacillus ginsengarvi]RKN64309.1 hypothetical protein D7M11_34020 [Paenibacillus ginsengarvi]
MSEDSRRMSRRKMLAALGIAGAAAVGLGVSQARGSTVTDFVYGGEEECPDHRCGVTPYDFGAAGDGIADDTAACRQWISYAYQHSVPALIPKGTFLADELYPLAGVKFIGLEYPKTGTYQTCMLSNFTPGKSVFKGDSVSRVCF